VELGEKSLFSQIHTVPMDSEIFGTVNYGAGRLFSVKKVVDIKNWRPAAIVIGNEIY
jgi:hypothetical protein